MDDKERLKVLEQALAQMLKPLNGIPFSVIVNSLAERQIIKLDKADGRRGAFEKTRGYHSVLRRGTQIQSHQKTAPE